MEKRKVILGSVLLLTSYLLITPSRAQMCDIMIDLTAASNEGRVRVDSTGRVCLQCLNENSQTDPSTVWGLRDGSTISDTENLAPMVGEYSNGVLVLLPGVLRNGSTGEYGPLSCDSVDLMPGYNYFGITLYSSVLLPPTLTSVSIERRVEEGTGPTALVCLNSNSPEVANTYRWFRTSDPGTILSMSVGGTQGRFTFPSPILRVSTGEYDCQLVSLITGETASVTAQLIVEFAPEVSFPTPVTSLFLDANLILTCNYVAVPMPTVDWLLNGAVLDTSDPRITVSLTGDSSELRIEGVARNEGGLYNCRFENGRGISSRNVTTLLVRTPPEPVVDITVDVTQIEETTIPLSWTNAFDGHSEVLEAIVTYSIAGQQEQMMTVPGSNPTTATLSNLMPFMTYNITVTLRNAVGISEPVSTTATTLSLFLGAPTITSFVADNSTMLTVVWAPPPEMDTTESTLDWTVMFEGVDSTEMPTSPPSPLLPTTLTTSFSGLEKGRNYRVRIRGRNSRGNGNYSDYQTVQTIVDPPDMPTAITVETISSFAMRVSWSEPSDNGGRPILRYFITVMEQGGADLLVNLTAEATTFNLILRDPDVTLVNSTTYVVNVAAQNTMGLVGTEASAMNTTLDINQPQPNLNPLRSPTMPSNRTIQLMWEHPGGTVNEFLIEYEILADSDMAPMSVSVNGTETSFLLTGLATGTTYSIVIITVNDNGMSIPSPAAQFTTRRPDNPVVTGPDGPVTEGENVLLICTTPDDREITWFDGDGRAITTDDRPVFDPMGTMNNSTLTINDVQLRNAGVYMCRVGQATATYMLRVMERPTTATTPEEGGISTNVIIIAACVAGGGALLIMLLLGVIIICCCCAKGDRDAEYTPKTKSPSKSKSKAAKTDKRTKELFEHSAVVSFAPMDTRGQRDTAVDFDIPEDFQGHSSFNTLDKPAKRSGSPEPTAQTSSFGKKTEVSPPRYQDMPPSYDDDGTVL